MIDDSDYEVLERYFVTKEEHAKDIKALGDKDSETNIRQAAIEADLKIIKWLVMTVLGSCVVIALNIIFKP